MWLWSWPTFKSFSIIGAMPLVWLSEYLQMPRLIPSSLEVVARGTVLWVVAHIRRVCKLPATALPVVAMVVGVATWFLCPVVAQDGSKARWLLILVLGVWHLESAPFTWNWPSHLHSLIPRMLTKPLMMFLTTRFFLAHHVLKFLQGALSTF